MLFFSHLFSSFFDNRAHSSPVSVVVYLLVQIMYNRKKYYIINKPHVYLFKNNVFIENHKY